MLLQTTDKKDFFIDKEHAFKSIFLRNIFEIEPCSDPVEVLIDSKTMKEIHEFMKKDKHVLEKDFNPLEINFSYEFLECFDHLSMPELLCVCNAANYLEYPFLLELCCKQLAIRISQGPEILKSEILGDSRITDDDFERITTDFEWLDGNL